MIYLAHTENERGVAHLLSDDLRGISELTAEFARQMNPALVEPASLGGG